MIQMLAEALQAEHPLNAQMAKNGWQVLGCIGKWTHGDRPQGSFVLNSPQNQDIREAKGLPRLLDYKVVDMGRFAFIEVTS